MPVGMTFLLHICDRRMLSLLLLLACFAAAWTPCRICSKLLLLGLGVCRWLLAASTAAIVIPGTALQPGFNFRHVMPKACEKHDVTPKRLHRTHQASAYPGHLQASMKHEGSLE